MINEQLLDYVQKLYENGIPAKQISDVLSEKGWDQVEVQEVLLQVQEKTQQKLIVPIAPANPARPNKKPEGLSVSQILLYLGGFIVVLAGIIFIGINWSQWAPLTRIFALFLPLAVCYISGASIFYINEHKNQGIVFLFVGSLLFPIFFSILFKELNIFANPFDENFMFTVSLLSLIMYFLSSRIFRFPIWSLLYQSAGLFVYYYFLKEIGIDDELTMAWLLLIPGTAYLILSSYYEKIEQAISGRYSYFISIIVLLFSFINLFTYTLFHDDKDLLSSILIIIGIAYFMLGILYEKNSLKKYCKAPYLSGVTLIFFSLLQLGSDGDLLKIFNTNPNLYSQNIIGWSNIIIGVFYLLIGWGIGKLKFLQLEIAPKFKAFFNFVAPLWILGALLFLSLDGKKFVYETLLLLSSLGFIFGSISKISRQYLYMGTFFLIVYIFDIGSEYFKNEVGWPVVLFVVGILSMGISVAIEKIRRKYFCNQLNKEIQRQ